VDTKVTHKYDAATYRLRTFYDAVPRFLDGTSTPLPAILDTARSLPLFLAIADGPVRVVLVRGFDPGGATEADLLEEYLLAPVESRPRSGAAAGDRRCRKKKNDGQARVRSGKPKGFLLLHIHALPFEKNPCICYQYGYGKP